MSDDDKIECVRSLIVVFVDAPTDGEWFRVFTEGLMLHERVAGYTLGPTFYESREKRIDEAKESVLRIGVIKAAEELFNGYTSEDRTPDAWHTDEVLDVRLRRLFATVEALQEARDE